MVWRTQRIWAWVHCCCWFLSWPTSGWLEPADMFDSVIRFNAAYIEATPKPRIDAILEGLRLLAPTGLQVFTLAVWAMASLRLSRPRAGASTTTSWPGCRSRRCSPRGSSGNSWDPQTNQSSAWGRHPPPDRLDDRPGSRDPASPPAAAAPAIFQLPGRLTGAHSICLPVSSLHLWLCEPGHGREISKGRGLKTSSDRG